MVSRSPHGERGLKYEFHENIPGNGPCRSPHGERGLKLIPDDDGDVTCGRSPHGERGLKCEVRNRSKIQWRSLPPRGAWIEMPQNSFQCFQIIVAPPTGSVD